MAAEEPTQQSAQAQEDNASRPVRRRPFSTWMRKLASFKNSSTHEAGQSANGKRISSQNKPNSKKQTTSKKNNPYPESGHVNDRTPANDRASSPVQTGTSVSASSFGRRRHSIRSSEDGHHSPTNGNKSAAPTVSTGIAPSNAPSSAQGTTGTMGVGTGRGVDSTFSSPAPSVRSLTTTLTTIHSAAAAPGVGQPANTNANNTQPMHFSHQFPTSPPNALPAHLAPHGSGGHPSTYNTATANNLLTDNASILTLASSSKRRRRRSMDTDASVRALAPSSLFGGSRESLPLSILSANIEASSSASHPVRASGPLNERASIYSTAGVAPALPSDRNSYYAGKQSHAADGSSVKSGFFGHGRNDSISGIGASGSPLASPIGHTAGTLSRSNSNWAPEDEADDVETETEGEGPKESKDNKDGKEGKESKDDKEIKEDRENSKV